MGNDLMPLPEPQQIRLYCNVCGKEVQHWRELRKHWEANHRDEYKERRKQDAKDSR